MRAVRQKVGFVKKLLSARRPHERAGRAEGLLYSSIASATSSAMSAARMFLLWVERL